MALHTKKQFAVLCGFTKGDGTGDTKKLSTYHGREKLIYSGDYVDDTIAKNIAFLTEMSAKAKKPAAVKPKVEKELRLSRPLNKKEMQAEEETGSVPNVGKGKQPDEDSEEFGEDYSKMVLEKKSLEIAKLKQEVQKLKLGNNKTQGDFVSIEAVKNLVVLHSESLKTSYENGLQEFIIKFSARNKLNRDEIFEMKSEITDSINSTMAKAIESTKKGLRRMQSDVATQRGVGERL